MKKNERFSKSWLAHTTQELIAFNLFFFSHSDEKHSVRIQFVGDIQVNILLPFTVIVTLESA